MKIPEPKPSVADQKLYRPDWTTGAPRKAGVLWLDKNENADPALLELTHSVLKELSSEGIRTYPECAPLYAKLGRHLNLDPHQLLLAAGSDGVIRTLFEAFVSPGDLVFHTSPTFAMYPVYSQMYGARVETLQYQRSPAGPVLDLKEMMAKIRKVRPRLVCLPNPDSPTGSVVNDQELLQIVEAAGSVGAVLLIDEAYHPFYVSAASSMVRDYPHVVIARTFAKAWGLAGFRIGYAIAHPEMAVMLHKVRPMYEVNTLAVEMVERMLDHADAVQASVQRLNEGREYFRAEMKALGFSTFPTHGNFLYAGFGARAEAIHASLKALALYRPDSNEECLKGYSRFTATTVALFKPLVQRIREVAG